MSAAAVKVAVDAITARILTLNGQHVILDVDLPALYGVPTKLEVKLATEAGQDAGPADRWDSTS